MWGVMQYVAELMQCLIDARCKALWDGAIDEWPKIPQACVGEKHFSTCCVIFRLKTRPVVWINWIFFCATIMFNFGC